MDAEDSITRLLQCTHEQCPRKRRSCYIRWSMTDKEAAIVELESYFFQDRIAVEFLPCRMRGGGTVALVYCKYTQRKILLRTLAC